MNILILNWRDIKNPRSGGAEIVTYKYASHWANIGSNVYWISNWYPGSNSQSNENKINFIRVKPFLSNNTLYLLFAYPIFLINALISANSIVKNKNIDLIVDEIHGLPFFTPLFFKKKIVLLVCEVAGPIWEKMWPFPINIIGKTLERLIYTFYKKSEIWAISKSTQQDIKSIDKKLTVKVLPIGIDKPEYKIYPKSSTPQGVVVSRLVPMKGIISSIQASKEICKSIPSFKLFIIGDGESKYVSFLKNTVDRMGLKNNIFFLGHVDEETKFKYLSESHFLFHPSYMEGFGLTVIEAASVGTPTISRASGNLKYLVKNKFGFTFHDDSDISRIFILNWKNSQYEKITKNCITNVKDFFWENIFQKEKILLDAK